MYKYQAREITGGLSDPEKMPGKAYGLPALECGVGSKLRAVKGSVCFSCYGYKGRYVFPPVQAAQYRRLASLTHPQWADAMVCLLNGESHFRWHDSGDIQSLDHLQRIVEVATRTPNVAHWLPTREYAIVAAYRREFGAFPDNLVVRLSAPMVGAQLPERAGPSSMVIAKGAAAPDGVKLCDAPHTREDGSRVEVITITDKVLLGHCGKCRACWDTATVTVGYGIH